MIVLILAAVLGIWLLGVQAWNITVVMLALGKRKRGEIPTAEFLCMLEQSAVRTLRYNLPSAPLLLVLALGADIPAAVAASAIFPLAAVLIAALAKPKLTKLLRIAQANQAIVSLEAQHPGGSTISIWVKRNTEAWPPLLLEFGIDQYNVSAETSPPHLMELVERTLEKTIDQETAVKIKEELNSYGATHPMDIRGAGASKITEEFFHQILFPKKT